MQHITTKGVESIVEVPVLSKTQDERGKIYEEHGLIRFKETILNYEDWYVGIVESKEFYIPFFNYHPVEGNPGMRTGYTHNSYHTIRLWVDSVIKATCASLLENQPQASLYNPDGTPEREPTEETMRQAFDLFKEARPGSKDVDGTPKNES